MEDIRMLETKSTKRLKIIKTIICTLTMIMLIAAIVFLFIVDDSKKIRRFPISHIAPKASENSTTLTQIYIWPIDKLILSLLTK